MRFILSRDNTTVARRNNSLLPLFLCCVDGLTFLSHNHFKYYIASRTTRLSAILPDTNTSTIGKMIRLPLLLGHILLFHRNHQSTCFTTPQSKIYNLHIPQFIKTSVPTALFHTKEDANDNLTEENLLERQRKATQTLDKIIQMESELSNSVDDATDQQDRKDVVIQDIVNLCEEMGVDFPPPSIAAQPSTTTTIDNKKTKTSLQNVGFDIVQASDYFSTKLPIVTQKVLAKLVDVPLGKENTQDIIVKLYENRARLYMEDTNIRKLIEEEIILSVSQNQYNRVSGTTSPTLSNKEGEEEEEETKSFDFLSSPFSLLEEIELDPDKAKTRRFVESSLPKVTRKEGKAPTYSDVESFLTILENTKSFNPSSRPEEIPGGYIIRGTNTKETGAEMIDSFEATFQASSSSLSKKYQYHYIKDPTPDALEDVEEVFGSPVLLFISNDVSPTTSPFLLSLVTAASLFLIFVFSLGTFASNDFVTQRLQDANAVGDFNDDWLNDLLLPMVVAIGGSQFAHEAGHFLIAKKDNFTISSPVVLPAIYLPTLGCATNIKTSPKNLSSLFDFALLGPVLGILSSIGFLTLGLQLTLSADAATYTYFPALPLEFLQISNLGFTIIQSYLGQAGSLLNSASDATLITGGSATVEAIGNAASSTSIPLHPLAVAGFATLYINSLNLLPLGNTDGGRISQAIFGRNGHTVIQGIIYLSLLSTAFLTGFDTTSNINANIYLGYALFCLFGQNDFEIPCRNEVDSIDFGRVLIAIASWVFVALTITSVV